MPRRADINDSFKRWRLLETPPSSGNSHMALDRALLESSGDGGFVPTMRFYRWSPPAVSIGRFQDIEDLKLDVCAERGIEVVRRPTGGKCILHLDDFTYSIVFPPGAGLPEKVVDAYTVLCQGIVESMRQMGLDAAVQCREGENYTAIKGACFAAATQADLECCGRKVCGSAQVRHSGSVLQHGSILIADNSRLLFELMNFESSDSREAGLRDYRRRCASLDGLGCHASWGEIAECFLEGFSRVFGVEVVNGELSAREKARLSNLQEIYASSEWLMGGLTQRGCAESIKH